MDMVKITLVGRVQPRDPEARFTAAGQQVTTFRMVCGHVRRGRDGERVEESDWFQVSTFGRLAETVANLVTKGSRVLVEGRFSSRVWQDNEGKSRTSLEVVANDVLLLDQRQRDDQSGSYAPASRPDAPDSDLEDLPF
ncbi:MAG: single-stranded DNA-binding protein [Chloroflexota bacterium]